MLKTREIDEYVDEEFHKFNSWIEGINRYLDYRYFDEKLPSDKLWTVTNSCIHKGMEFKHITL